MTDKHDLFKGSAATETASERRAKMLERVRGLLAKANDPSVGEAEAEAFRAKADDLMTAFAIDQWQLDSTAPGERVQPEIRRVNIDWWYDTSDSDQAAAVWFMFHSVAKHCRCVVAMRGQRGREMPLIGLPSDLDWMDELFTNLLLQLNRNLEVRPDSSKSLAENVYAMRMAGMGWVRITQLLWSAGLAEAPRGKAATIRRYSYREGAYVETTITAETLWIEIPDEVRIKIKNRLAQINRAYARDHGLERNYVRPDVYQRSFTEGFSTEVRHRLYKMRRDQETTYDASHGSNSMALVVQDIYTQAVALYNREFPPPKPDPNAKPRKASTAVVREKARDYGAQVAGAREGAKANLSNQASDRLGSDSPRLPR